MLSAEKPRVKKLATARVIEASSSSAARLSPSGYMPTGYRCHHFLHSGRNAESSRRCNSASRQAEVRCLTGDEGGRAHGARRQRTGCSPALPVSSLVFCPSLSAFGAGHPRCCGPCLRNTQHCSHCAPRTRGSPRGDQHSRPAVGRHQPAGADDRTWNDRRVLSHSEPKRT
jgi:hypothetical protein